MFGRHFPSWTALTCYMKAKCAGKAPGNFSSTTRSAGSFILAKASACDTMNVEMTAERRGLQRGSPGARVGGRNIRRGVNEMKTMSGAVVPKRAESFLLRRTTRDRQ